jgi:hypothetical protein
VAPDDWRVSEVDRGSEGRGADLARALAALKVVEAATGWWLSLSAAIDGAVADGR